MRSIEIPHPEDRDWSYRSLEILPFAITLSVLAIPIALAFISSNLAAYFIFAYLLLWFCRAMALDVRMIQGWRLMGQHRKAPWDRLLRDLEDLTARVEKPSWHGRNLERVSQYMNTPDRILPSQVYHAVIIAFYNETREVLLPTVQSVLDANYDNKKIILVVAYEQRGGPSTEKLANELVKKFGKQFYHAEAVKHPPDIAGEVIGKGGNVTYAGRWLQGYLAKAKIDSSHVLVTTLDSDNRPDKEYFGALTYTYCSTEDPKRASYQPITMYTNNIWDAPAPMRVIATGNSFWNIVLSLRQHLLRNFSAHAQPMSALIDTDFWSVRTIVEDGHQYWRTFFRYDGQYEVYPLYVPIYQDAVLTESYKRTLSMQFVQVRRWAWGASDIAYVITKGFREKNGVPRHRMWGRMLRLVEGHISWSTAPLILLLAAFVPLFVSSDSYTANELPQFASKLQRVAMVGIIISLYLSIKSLPPRPERYKRHRNVWMMLQWLYLPVTSIIYSAFAAIYAQYRLATGRYLGFIVTEKAVAGVKSGTTEKKKSFLRRLLRR